MGVAALGAQIQQATDQRIQFECDSREKTFTDKHGDALAAQVHRLCNAADDAGLPEVHRVLAKAPKSKKRHRNDGSAAALKSLEEAVSNEPVVAVDPTDLEGAALRRRQEKLRRVLAAKVRGQSLFGVFGGVESHVCCIILVFA